MTNMPADPDKVTSLASFLEQVEVLGLLGGTPLFRGQGPRGNLLPSIARADPTVDTTKVEKQLLEQLRLQGASLINGAMSEIDLLIQAQHYGMRTRLLDWTSNPLVALWFACNTADDSHAYVYALDSADLMAKEITSPFSLTLTRVVQPPMNNPRIVAQHGWFTLHSFSNKAKRFVSLEENRVTKSKLHEFEIDGTEKSHLLEALDRVGISAKTIWPDLEGLCSHLNKIYLG